MRLIFVGTLALLLASCQSKSSPSHESRPPSDGKPSRPAETVTLRTTDGVLLKATLRRGARADAPAVVLLHQLGSTRAEWNSMVEALAAPPGPTVLALDFRGHGESLTKEDGQRLAYVRFGLREWHTLSLDVRAALDFLEAEAALTPSRIVVAGSAIGSTVALMAAAEDRRIEAVVAISPDLEHRGLSSLRPAALLGERALLLLAGDKDQAAVHAASVIRARVKNASFVVVEGGGHGAALLERPRAQADFRAFVHHPEVSLER